MPGAKQSIALPEAGEMFNIFALQTRIPQVPIVERPQAGDGTARPKVSARPADSTQGR
jgi:hypothetical protein